MKFHTLLFDLDGTLTDPKEGITKSVSYALSNFGIEELPENLTCFIGPPLKESFMTYYHMTNEEAEEAIKKYRERFSEVGIFENRVYEGIADLLAALKVSGKRIALATSKPYIFAKQILDKYEIEQYFDYIVGSELDGTRSEKAEVIGTVLSQANISQDAYSGCLMIGDRKHDIIGAKVCQIPSLGVRFGYAEEDELEQAGANYIVKDVEELKDFLLNH